MVDPSLPVHRTKPRTDRRVRVLVVVALAIWPLAARAVDQGSLSLWCKGTERDSGGAKDEDASRVISDKKAKAVIDFAARSIDFLSWSHVPITQATPLRILADRNAFETGTGYHISIDRVSGDVSLQTLVHDSATGDTWFRHSFIGKCWRADKAGRPDKAPSGTGGGAF